MNGKRDAGFSFVELMIAVFVLAMGIIPAFFVFFRGNVGTVLNRDEITARQYAGEVLDYFRARDYDQVTVTTDRIEFPLVPGGAAIDGKFKRFLAVKRLVPNRGIADWPVEYKIVTVEVEWSADSVPQVFVQTNLLFKGRS
jgi:hypothetical protein